MVLSLTQRFMCFDAISLRRPVLSMNHETMPVLPPLSALQSYHTQWAMPKNLLQEQILSAITHGPRSIDMVQAKRVIILCNLPQYIVFVFIS